MGLFTLAAGLLKNVVPIIGDMASSAFGDILGDDNAEKAYGQSKEASALQFEREYGAYKTRYQDTMADMEKAGLNPILAASGGFNVGSGPKASTAQAFQSQPVTTQPRGS